MTLFSANMTPQGIGDPARKMVAITFDTDETSGILRGVYNGASAAKDISITQLDGTDVTLKNVASGTIVPVLCKHVNTTGTTALAAELLGVV